MRVAAIHWPARFLACSAIVAALAYIPYRVYGSDGYVRYRELEREDTELAASNEALKQENAQLARTARRLKDDLSAVAEAARDDLGMVKPGEIVMQIEAPRPTPAAAQEGDR